MRPRDLNAKNWDVNVAVFEAPTLDARVTADGKRMWFRIYGEHCSADVVMPIGDFRRAADFISDCLVKPLTDESTGRRVGTFAVEVSSRIGVRRNGRWVLTKMPRLVHLSRIGRNKECDLLIRLSMFKKLIRWYNSDI